MMETENGGKSTKNRRRDKNLQHENDSKKKDDEEKREEENTEKRRRTRADVKSYKHLLLAKAGSRTRPRSQSLAAVRASM